MKVSSSLIGLLFLSACGDLANLGDSPKPQVSAASQSDRSPLQVKFAAAPTIPEDRRGFIDVNITHQGKAAALDNRRNVWITEDMQTWKQVYTVPNGHPPPSTVALDPKFQAFFLGHTCKNACYSLISVDGKNVLRDPQKFWVKRTNGETYKFPIHDAHWDRGIWVGLGEWPNRGGEVLSLPSPLEVSHWMERPLMMRKDNQPQAAFVAAVTADDSGLDYLGIWQILNSLGNQGYGFTLQWNNTLDLWLPMGQNDPVDDLPNEVPLSMGARGKGRLAVLYQATGLKYQHVGKGVPWRTVIPEGLQGQPKAVALDPQGYAWLATDQGLFRSDTPLP